MVVTYVGYSIGSWGYVLLKGYNITLREWFSPLSPYQWPPAGTPIPVIPKGRLWPTAAGRPGGGLTTAAGTGPAPETTTAV